MSATAKLALALLLATLVVGCASAPPKEEAKPVAEKASSQPATTAPAPVPESERWRAETPQPEPIPKLVIPEIKQAKLKNGVTLLLNERHELPLVDVRVALRAGSASEPVKKAGLADLTYELMLEGAGKRDGVALAEAFSDLGTAVSVGTAYDGASFHMTVLRRNLDPALALLAEVVQKPRLDQADFERKQKEFVANLARALGSPGYLLFRTTSEVVFGADHPYGHLGGGKLDTLPSIKLADVKRFHKQKVGPKVAAVLLSGDVSLEDATALAGKHFGKWRGRARPPKKPTAIEPSKRDKVHVVAKPGLGQTFIAVARPALAAGDAEEWQLALAVAVFGGMFSSRLNMNLREDKGFTYGARGWLDKRYGGGALTSFAPVQADKTGASLQEFFKEIEGINQRPVTQEEFVMARDSDLRSVPGWFETVGRMTGTMASIFYLDLPVDRIQQMVTAYEKMELAQVQAAAKKHFDPETMQVVLVGDPDLIEKQIAELKLGSIDVQTPPTAAPPTAPAAMDMKAKKAAREAGKAAAKAAAKKGARAAAKAKAKARAKKK